MKTPTVLRTRGGARFQHIGTAFAASADTLKYCSQTTKTERGATYKYGMVGPLDSCWPQWVREDNLRECAQ